MRLMVAANTKPVKELHQKEDPVPETVPFISLTLVPITQYFLEIKLRREVYFTGIIRNKVTHECQ